MPTRFELRFCVGHPPMIIDMVGLVGLRYDGYNRNCLRPAIFAPAYGRQRSRTYTTIFSLFFPLYRPSIRPCYETIPTTVKITSGAEYLPLSKNRHIVQIQTSLLANRPAPFPTATAVWGIRLPQKEFRGHRASPERKNIGRDNAQK